MDAEDVEAKTDVREESSRGCYIKTRYVLAFMEFLGMFNMYSLRTNLSVAIVAMVNLTRNEGGINTNMTICPSRGSSGIAHSTQHGTFTWSTSEQGLLLGCYFYGYIFTCMPGGYLARRFGVRIVLGTSMVVSSVITLLFPVLSYAGFAWLVVSRILLGFLQGVSTPAIVTGWGNWAPPLERSFLISFPFAGSSFGTFVTLPLAGIISDKFGWESVFYFTGGFAFIWSIVWFGIIHSSPQEHPRISEREKTYIIQSIGPDKSEKPGLKSRTPWKGILTSPCVWGIIAGHFASNWGNNTLIALLPTYMAVVLGFDLSASGELSALPFILQFLFTVGGGYMTDVIRSRHLLSTVAIRKLDTTLGLVVSAIMIILVGYINCDFKAAVALFSLSVAFNSLTVPGCKANTVDISPQYGGIIFGMSNTIANIAGFLAPQVAGMMLVNEGSISQWQSVFWVSGALYILGAIIFLVFGSGEEQPWSSETWNLQSSGEDEECEEESLSLLSK